MSIDALSDQLTQLLADRERLNAEADDLARQSEELRKALGVARQTVRALQKKVKELEQTPCVLDGVDEEWLWANQAEIRFRRRLNDNARRLTVRRKGYRRQLFVGEAESKLLQEAVEVLSGRQRDSSKQQKQKPKTVG